MLHPYLRSKTDEQHQLLERTFNALLEQVRLEKEYEQLLKKMAGFLIPLETAIHATPLLSIVPDIMERKRMVLLMDDIRDFDPSWDQPSSVNLEFIKDTPSALGAMYVLEGSTMGGPIIARMIRQQTGISSGFRYFESYGHERKQKWNQFKQFLDLPILFQQKEIIANAALTCFSRYKQWLESSNSTTL